MFLWLSRPDPEICDGELRKCPHLGLEEVTKLREVIQERPKSPAFSLAWTFGCRARESGTDNGDPSYWGSSWTWRPWLGDFGHWGEQRMVSELDQAYSCLRVHCTCTLCSLHPRCPPTDPRRHCLPSTIFPSQHLPQLPFGNSTSLRAGSGSPLKINRPAKDSKQSCVAPASELATIT